MRSEVKQFAVLHRGISGLEPILGRSPRSKSRAGRRGRRRKRHSSGRSRHTSQGSHDGRRPHSSSFSYPAWPSKAASSGFGEIDFLRNKLGLTMPTTLHTLQSHRLQQRQQQHLSEIKPIKEVLKGFPVIPRREDLSPTPSYPDTQISYEKHKSPHTPSDRRNTNHEKELEMKLRYLKARRMRLFQSSNAVENEGKEKTKEKGKKSKKKVKEVPIIGRDSIVTRVAREKTLEEKVETIQNLRKFGSLRTDKLRMQTVEDVDQISRALEKLKRDRRSSLERHIREREDRDAYKRMSLDNRKNLKKGKEELGRVHKFIKDTHFL